MATTVEVLAAYADIKTLFDRVLMRAEIQDNKPAGMAGLLMATIAESYGAIGVLCGTPYASHSPVHCRAMMESYVNLKLLVDDPAHADQILFENARQSLKVLRGFAGDAEVAADQTIMAELDAIRQQHSPVFDAYTAQGFREISIFDLFVKAGKKQLYISYRFLCTFSHNQFGTLVARHFDGAQLLMGQPLPAETLEMILSLSVSIYGQALELAPKFSDLTAEDVRVVHEQVNARWDALKGQNP